MAMCVIFGAGKIARGFIGHLLFLGGHEFIFIEKNRLLCDLINQKEQYTVNILGAPEKNCIIKGGRAVCFEDTDEVLDALSKADLIFTAMGGKNLDSFCGVFAKYLSGSKADRGKNLNIITCENWKEPARFIKDRTAELLGACADKLKNIGFAESVVMRSAIEPSPEQLEIDPLCVNVQDFWDLPVDEKALKDRLPAIPCLRPVENFNGFLEKKFYTYNAANGTVSYLGALMGYRYIHEAARDDFILKILSGVYSETGSALSKKYSISGEEMKAFAQSSLDKLQDQNIKDYIERNARDPMRKLGPDDRLVGSARLCLQHGVTPCHLAVSVAAAIHYTSEGDCSAQELAELRQSLGTGGVLREVCGLEPGTPLYELVLEKEQMLDELGLIQRG